MGKKSQQVIETNVLENKSKTIEVQNMQECLSNILDSFPYPFYIIDTNDYTIKMANSATRMDSLSDKSTCYALTHKRSKPCTGKEHPCPIEEVKKTKKPVTVEHTHYDKDGNTRNFEVNAYPIFDSVGNISQMVEYSLDITTRKKADEKGKPTKISGIICDITEQKQED